MRSTDDAHIGLNRYSTAQALELSLLHDAKKLWLQLERKIADLIQKQRATVSPLEPPNTARHRSGVGAALVTEQFAFEQTCRYGGAIHFHKWAVRSAAPLVNGFRNQLLAGSCFPVDQHRGAGRRHDSHHAKYAP